MDLGTTLNGFKQCFDVLVIGHFDVRAARRAKCHKPRVRKPDFLRFLKESEVLGVGARPPAFDVIDSEAVKTLGERKLVLKRKTHSFALRSVA